MRSVKTIVAIILLGALVAPVAFQLYGLVRLSHMRENFEKRLEHEEMHTLVIKESEVAWVKAGKEIRFQGRMFDIKEMTDKDGWITFKGLFDDDEKALEEKLAQAAKQKKDAAAQCLSSLFMSLVFEQPPEFYDNTVFSIPQKKTNTGYINSRYASLTSDAPVNPPWLCS